MNIFDAYYLTPKQSQSLREFLDIQNAKGLAYQQQTVNPDDPDYARYRASWEAGVPFVDPDSGLYTVEFTPTTNGVTVIKVRHHVTGNVINLTTWSNGDV